MIGELPAGPSFAVFLRAANVGGHQVFKPSALARDLSSMRAKSIGAAGTFAFLEAGTEQDLRRALAKALPFAPEAVVVKGAAISALLKSKPFGNAGPPAGEMRFASALMKRPTAKVQLPLERPTDATWQIRLTAIHWPFVLSVRRPKQPGKFYPNEVVERAFGVPATTRSWNTIEALGRALTDG